MKAASKKKIFSILLAFTLLISVFVVFQNCGSSGSGGGGGAIGNKGAAGGGPGGLGTFVDDPVAGLNYTTSSGLSGVTNSLGQFQFNPGDTVTFYAMGVQIGVVTPVFAANGTVNVTPLNLVPGATTVTDPQVTAIAQILNTLNAVNVANGGSPSTGIFTLPSGTNQLQSLQIPTSNSTQGQQQQFANQLLSLLQTAFPALTITVTAASDAQTALQNGINMASIIGTVWSGTCTCSGGATLYFQPGGVVSGLTTDGHVIVGTWTVDGSGNVSFSGATTDGNGSGTGGSILAGATTGTLQIIPGVNGGNTGTLNLMEVTSASVSNNSWVGPWVITATATAFGNSIGDTGGCANMIVGPNFFSAVTNDGQEFTGAIGANGAASGSFPNGSGTTSLSFSMASLSGTAVQNGQVSDTLTISQSGACAVSKNKNGSNSSPTPTPTATPAGGGNILLNLSLSWANTPTSANSISVTVTVYDSTITQLNSKSQSESSGTQNNSGTRSTTTDNIALSWPTGVGATYTVTVGSSPCSVSNGSGSVGTGSFPTVQITCN